MYVICISQYTAYSKWARVYGNHIKHLILSKSLLRKEENLGRTHRWNMKPQYLRTERGPEEREFEDSWKTGTRMVPLVEEMRFRAQTARGLSPSVAGEKWKV